MKAFFKTTRPVQRCVRFHRNMFFQLVYKPYILINVFGCPPTPLHAYFLALNVVQSVVLGAALPEVPRL